MNELIQIQNKDDVEMMVNINRNFEIRTCYFEVAFSLDDACFKKAQRKQIECNVSHMESDNVRFPCQLNLGHNNIKDKVEKCVKAIQIRQNITENCDSLKIYHKML